MMASERDENAEPVSPQMPETALPEKGTALPAKGGILPSSPLLNGFDLLLALGTIVLGFGLASFTARNSDIWLHLGTGRLIADGNYEFNKDPFSYVGSDRIWVNHSWLADVVTYTVYSKLGSHAVVISKAVLMAVLTLLLLLICRKVRGRWLGVMCVGLTLLTAAPGLQLRPSLLSLFYLGITLYLLVGVSIPARSWKWPSAMAITWGLWANCDQWFILGPTILILHLIGTFLELRFLPRDENIDRPAIRTMLIGLGLGVLACTLNPHHVHVWRLPPEIASKNLSDWLGKDPQFAAMFHSLLDKGVLDFDNSSGGNPVNAYAFLLLLALNVLGFAMNFRHFSAGLLLNNVGLLMLAFYNARTLPFFAVAAGPTAALNLGEWIARLRQRSYASGTLQILAAGRVMARMILLLCGLAALAACYPGWLHPLNQQRRLAWDIEADPELRRTAETMQTWRMEGQVPPEAHSLILSANLADYCPWFAPAEKTFFDSRIGFHEPEAETYQRLRRHFILRAGAPTPQDFDAAPFLEKEKISHVVVGSTNSVDALVSFHTRLRSGSNGKLQWDLWSIHGRYAIFGWREQSVLSRHQFSALNFDALGLAFGKETEPLPNVTALQPPMQRDFLEKYLQAAPAWPEAATESSLLRDYDEFLREPLWRFERRRDSFLARLFLAGSSFAPTFGVPVQPPLPRQLQATPLLAVRAGRRAILQSPAHPEGYLSLAFAYTVPNFDGAFPHSREFILAATLERYFARASLDQLLAAGDQAYRAASLLANLHFHQLQYAPIAELRRANLRAQNVELRADLGLAALKKARLVLVSLPQLQGVEGFRNELKALDALIQRWEEEVRNQENRWLNAGGDPSPLNRALVAVNFWLPAKAIENLKKINMGDDSQLPLEQRIAAMLNLARLYLLTGQAELADAEIIAAEKAAAGIAAENRPDQQNILFSIRELRKLTSYVLGRFTDVAEIMLRNAAEEEFFVDRIRREQLPIAASLSIARRLASPKGMPLIETLVEAHRPGLGNQLAQLNFKGNPFLVPMFDEYVLMLYRNQQMSEGDMHLQLGLVYLEMGDNVRAAKQFRQVLQAVPAYPPTQLRVNATTYLKLMQDR